jgi:hypothetical protein
VKGYKEKGYKVIRYEYLINQDGGVVMMKFQDLEVWKRATRLSSDVLSGLIKTKRGFLKNSK